MRSRLTDWKPAARASSTQLRVTSRLCSRLTACWTSGSKSCTPTDSRLKPSAARAWTFSGGAVRGSTSMLISARGASVKRARSSTIIRCSSSLERKVGRAAAQMQLFDAAPALEVAGDEVDFALQEAQVLGGLGVIAGDDLVAAAVVADRVAERDVDVQRQRAHAAGAGLGQPAGVRVRIEGLDETVGGGIGGIARSGLVVAAQRRPVGQLDLRRGLAALAVRHPLVQFCIPRQAGRPPRRVPAPSLPRRVIWHRTGIGA